MTSFVIPRHRASTMPGNDIDPPGTLSIIPLRFYCYKPGLRDRLVLFLTRWEFRQVGAWFDLLRAPVRISKILWPLRLQVVDNVKMWRSCGLSAMIPS